MGADVTAFQGVGGVLDVSGCTCYFERESTISHDDCILYSILFCIRYALATS